MNIYDNHNMKHTVFLCFGVEAIHWSYQNEYIDWHKNNNKNKKTFIRRTDYQIYWQLK